MSIAQFTTLERGRLRNRHAEDEMEAVLGLGSPIRFRVLPGNQ
jgi:hypothetical protein